MIALLPLLLCLGSPGFAQEPVTDEVIVPVEVAAPAEAGPGELDADTDVDSELHSLREQIEHQAAELSQMRARLDARDRVHQEPPSVGSELLEVDGERVSFGSPTVISSGEVVTEAVSFGGDVTVSGHVMGDAASFGGSVRVLDGGRVDGDAVSFGGSVLVSPEGTVGGDRVSLGSSAASIHMEQVPQALQSAQTVEGHAPKAGRGALASLYRRLVFLLSFMGAGVLIVGLFPERVGRVAARLSARPLRSLIVGSFASVSLTIAALLFAVTIVGIPVSILLVGVLGLTWLIGFVGLCQALGDRIPLRSEPHRRWVAFLIGALIVAFIGMLPVVGWLVAVVASALGMGAALGSRFGSSARA